MHTDVLSADYPNAVSHAADVLKHGGIVAFPTDTVYGLAALPTLEDSIESLYIIKGRTRIKAIALLMAHFSELDLVAQNVSPIARSLAERFWPGPLTLIVPRHPSLPGLLSNTSTIGVRVPDHPVALSLLQLTGPLGVTSANLSGEANTCTAREVLAQLDGRFHLLIDGGETPGGVPSTVVDCSGPKPNVLREGPITADQIQAFAE
jgi:L-threonylcarbamoyladenylate synthase